MLSQILKEIKRGVTIITANQRSARWLHYHYSRQQIGLGISAWESPRVYAWPVWLRRSWAQLSLPMVYLNTSQTEQVWRGILEESAVSESLLNVSGAANLAREAWQLQHQWRIELDKTNASLNEDSRAYLDWASRYRSKCKRNKWLDDEIALEDLLTSVKAGTRLDERVVLVGFDELTPAQVELFDAMADAGCEIHQLHPDQECQHAYRIGLLDDRSELLTVARWARSRLEENPETRIGIVVPDLAKLRNMVITQLSEILEPASVLLETKRHNSSFNLSLGLPLIEQAVISHAVVALQCVFGSPGIEDLGRLLRSPYIGYETSEVQDRHIVEQYLRRLGDFKPGIWTLIRLLRRMQAERQDSEFCSVLLAVLESVRELANKTAGAHSVLKWAQRFDEVLRNLGWPESEALEGEEMQALKSWKEVMGRFLGLEVVVENITAQEALSGFIKLLREQTFQPATAEAPIQVLGMLEASGMEFDFLWVTGLHEQAWPVSPRPNPFLPIRLQRAKQLPHSSVERELKLARSVIQRLKQSTRELVVSYPQKLGDQEVNPSLVITDLQIVDITDLALPHYPRYRELVHRSADLEELVDFVGPKVSGRDLQGGVRLFELQAQCPFRAFSELRLNARSLDDVTVGLDAISRGTLVHRVMEGCWKEIRDQRALVAMSEQRLKELIESVVNESVDRMAQEKPGTFTKRFTEIEKRRLRYLTEEWFVIEKGREPFAVVECEQAVKISIGGVTVSAIVDRIDELEDGGQLLIDYKTGKVSPKGWTDERIENPQLPLYSQSVKGELAGVAVAQIRKGEMALKGVVKNDCSTNSLQEAEKLSAGQFTWEGLRTHWRTDLEALAKEYLEGHAAVSPKTYPGSCCYCDLTAFCRVNELSFSDTEQEAGE